MKEKSDFEKTIDSNKIGFKQATGKEWNEDLTAFLTYINGAYLAAIHGRLGELKELQPMKSELANVRETVNKFARHYKLLDDR